MATTRTVNLTASYEDYTERTYKIPLQETQSTATIKTQIQLFNTAAGTENSSVRQTFLSENGARISAITDAVTVVKTEEEIYHA